MSNVFMCIDLKCFYATVECVRRKVDPFTTPLAVCDTSRGSNAIVLAISPYLKSLGYKSRCRHQELKGVKNIIFAKPHMNDYIKASNAVYDCFLDYVDAEDIHVYSIDESFLDLTNYMRYYNDEPTLLAKRIIDHIEEKTGFIAVAGVGTNMFLAKVTLDILAKHSPTRVDFLDQDDFIRRLWNHKPLTDIWQIGERISDRLINKLGLNTLHDIALSNEEDLKREFGVIGTELYYHSWGIDETKMSDIKAYVPSSKNISKAQVLFSDYNYEDAKVVLAEMVELITLELVKRHVKAKSIGLYVGFSRDLGGFGKQAGLFNYTNSHTIFLREFNKLYESVPKNMPIRVVGLSLNNLVEESFTQLSLFEVDNAKEVDLYRTILELKAEYGKNAINKAINYTKASTGVIRNNLIGGHNAE